MNISTIFTFLQNCANNIYINVVHYKAIKTKGEICLSDVKNN